MARKKKQQRRIWLSSTLIVLVSIFIVAVIVGVWRYGWQTVIDESIMYIIGATFTAIVIYLVSVAYKLKSLKRMVK